jgi:hypothetical protein
VERFANELMPDIPQEQCIIAEGQKFIHSLSSWTPGKTYHNKVKTYRRPKQPGDAASWCCRVSEHAPEEATFDQLWDKLGRNKAANEQQSVHGCLSPLAHVFIAFADSLKSSGRWLK